VLHIATLMLLFGDISYLVMQVVPSSTLALPSKTDIPWDAAQINHPQS
jgi:cytochrome c oxidase assembly protein subunit 15